MSEPFETAARASRRRIAVLTAVAGVILWLLASAYGTFGAWAIANAVSEDTSAWLLGTIGAAVGLLVVVALVWATVGHAAGRVHTAFGDLIVEVEDLRWRRAVGLGAGLGLAMGIPAPRIWLIELDAPNALAVGIRPDRTDVYLTTGLTDLLTRDEQEAVLASVMASIARFDVALGTVGYAIGDALVDLASLFRDWDPRGWIPSLLLAPFGLAGWLTKRLTLKWRGEGSDAAAMGYTRHPRALYSALVKLERDRRDVGLVPISTRQLWFEYPLNETSATTDRTSQRPVPLTRRLALVADELRAIDPSWQPPTAV